MIRHREDFVCDNCQAQVKGNGYTNHCPHCLWSKHADESLPGDRLSTCGGLMEPIGIELKNGQHRIAHRCQKCGKKAINKTSAQDNLERIIKLSQGLTKTA